MVVTFNFFALCRKYSVYKINLMTLVRSVKMLSAILQKRKERLVSCTVNLDRPVCRTVGQSVHSTFHSVFLYACYLIVQPVLITYM